MYWGERDHRNAARALAGDAQTAQRAEVAAVLHALASTQEPVVLWTDRRYVHDKLCALKGGSQADKHGAADDGVTDVQLAHPRQRRNRLYVHIVQRMTGVEEGRTLTEPREAVPLMTLERQAQD